VDLHRRQIITQLPAWTAVLWITSIEDAFSQTKGSALERGYAERLQRAEQQEQEQVERLYSTKPIRVLLGKREFRVPANYFSPKKRNEPDRFVPDESGFGFSVFLPDYGGFTKENWRQGWFHPDLIKVTQLKLVDKDALVTSSDGKKRPQRPEMWGDPVAGYRNLKRLFEEVPAFNIHGLEGYRRGGGGATPGVLWTGHRSNGEFFVLQTTLEPGQQPLPGRYSFASTQYYSEQEDLFIAYRYPQPRLEMWREIDAAIWSKLHSWRVK
jgi:hypothetical protein